VHAHVERQSSAERQVRTHSRLERRRADPTARPGRPHHGPPRGADRAGALVPRRGRGPPRDDPPDRDPCVRRYLPGADSLREVATGAGRFERTPGPRGAAAAPRLTAVHAYV